MKFFIWAHMRVTDNGFRNIRFLLFTGIGLWYKDAGDVIKLFGLVVNLEGCCTVECCLISDMNNSFQSREAIKKF